MDDGVVVSVTSLLLIGGVQLMDQLGPGIDDVRVSAGDPKMRAQINTGELLAGGTVLAAGIVLARVADSPAPFVMAAVVVAGTTLAYELAWRAGGTTIDPLTGRTMRGATS